MNRARHGMATHWSNWSGSIVNHPRRWLQPPDEDELRRALATLAPDDWPIRAVGTGHSSSGVVEVDGTLVSTGQLRGLVSVDATARRATVRAGTQLKELGELLYSHDLMLPNFGDVATQTIGGAIGTGTHGAGLELRNLSDMLVAAELVDAQGRLNTIDEHDPQRLRAAKVALGTLGIFTRVTLQLEPYADVERREFAVHTDHALAMFDDLARRNRSFDFYWYPRRDDVKLRMVNVAGGGTVSLPGARLLEVRGGAPYDVIPTHSGIPHRFEECEYALPADAWRACFDRVRRRMRSRWRHVVGWRVLVRTVAGDDALLSPCHGGDRVTISLHQNSTLPWRAFFDDMEPVFRDHGGRPHWAKKHGMDAAGLAPLYPQWAAFAQVRAVLDPRRAFMGAPLRRLLEVDDGRA